MAYTYRRSLPEYLVGYEDASLGRATGEIDITSASIGRAIGSLNTLSKVMLGVGLAAAAGLAFAVNKAADFEQEMARFGSIGNATQDQMDQIGKKARQLGVDSGFGATQTLKAFTELAYAGASTTEIINGLGDATIHLAAAGEIPAADAAKTLINTMRQFGIDGSHAEDVANAIARAANASTIDINDLNTSLRYVGSTAASMGLTFEDTTKAIALLGNEGIRGSTAGTTLRGVLVGLQANSGPAKEALHALGLDTNEVGNNFFTAEGKLRSFRDISEILRGALGGLADQVFNANGELKSTKEINDLLSSSTVSLTDKQKLYAFSVLFGRRAMTGAFALAKEGATGYDNLGNSAQYATTAQDIMNKRLDTLQGAWKKFKAALENAAITVGNVLLPALRDITDGLNDVVTWFDNLDPSIQEAIVWAVVGAATFLIFGAAIFKVGSWVFRLYRAFRDFKTVADIGSALKSGGLAEFLGSLAGAAGAVLPFVLAIAAIIAGFTAMWIWFEKIKAFLEENPWLALILAIVAPWLVMAFLIVGALRWLYDNAEQIWAEIESVFNDVVDWLSGAWDDIEQAFNDAVDFITGAWDDIKQAFEDAKQWIGEAIDNVVNFFRTLPGRILKFLENLGKDIGHAFEEAGKAILKFIENIPTYLQNLPLYIQQALSGAINWLSTTGVEIMMGLLNGLLQGVLFVLGWFIQLPFLIWQAVALAATWLFQTGVDIFTGLVNGLWAGIVAVWNFFITVIPLIPQFFADAISWLLQAGIDIITGLWNGLVAGVTAVWNFFAGILPGILGFFGDAIGWLLQAGMDVLQGFWDGADQIWQAVIGWFEGFAGNILTAVGELGDTLLNAGMAVIQGLWDGARQIWDTLFNWLTNLGDWIVTAVGDLGDILLNAGEAVIQGLIDGIDSMLGPLRDIASEVSDIISGIGDLLGISSPSKVMRYIGEMAMLGLVKGLNKDLPEIQNWVNAVNAGTQLVPAMAAGGGDHYGPIQLVVNLNGNVSNPQETGRQVGIAAGRAYMQTVRSQGRRS